MKLPAGGIYYKLSDSQQAAAYPALAKTETIAERYPGKAEPMIWDAIAPGDGRRLFLWRFPRARSEARRALDLLQKGIAGAVSPRR